MLNELSPALSEVSLYFQDVTCRIDILDYLLIHMVPRLRIVMHLQESKVLLQCRSLLWASLGVQDDPLEESFVLGGVRIPEGVHGLANSNTDSACRTQRRPAHLRTHLAAIFNTLQRQLHQQYLLRHAAWTQRSIRARSRNGSYVVVGLHAQLRLITSI